MKAESLQAEDIFRKQMHDAAAQFVTETCEENPQWSADFQNGYIKGVAEAMNCFVEAMIQRNR